MPVHSLRCNIIFFPKTSGPTSAPLFHYPAFMLVTEACRITNGWLQQFSKWYKDKSKIILPSSETWKKSTFLGFNHNSSCAKVLCPVHRNRNKPAFIITQREIKAYMRKGSYKFLQFRVLFMQDPFANTSYKKIANTLLFSEEGKG